MGRMSCSAYRCRVSPLYSCTDGTGGTCQEVRGDMPAQACSRLPSSGFALAGTSKQPSGQSTCACALRRSTLSRHSADFSTSWKRFTSAMEVQWQGVWRAQLMRPSASTLHRVPSAKQCHSAHGQPASGKDHDALMLLSSSGGSSTNISVRG